MTNRSLKVAYSLAGEGLGHATRACAMYKALVDHGHEVVFFTGGSALPYLKSTLHLDDEALWEIPVPVFAFTSSGKVDPLRTIVSFWRYLGQMKKSTSKTLDFLERWRPNIGVVDFEPMLPRLLSRVDCPYITLDSQHYYSDCILDELSSIDHARAFVNKLLVRLFSRNEVKRVIASPFEVKPKDPGMTMVTGSFLRPAVIACRNYSIRRYDHYLVYMHKAVLPQILPKLVASGLRFKVYGSGAQPSLGQVSFHASDEKAFLHDLCTCRAIVGGAGTSLISECRFLEIPSIFIPIGGQLEQRINASLASRIGFVTCDIRDFEPKMLDNLPIPFPNYSEDLNGPEKTVLMMERLLQ